MYVASIVYDTTKHGSVSPHVGGGAADDSAAAAAGTAGAPGAGADLELSPARERWRDHYPLSFDQTEKCKRCAHGARIFYIFPFLHTCPNGLPAIPTALGP